MTVYRRSTAAVYTSTPCLCGRLPEDPSPPTGLTPRRLMRAQSRAVLGRDTHRQDRETYAYSWRSQGQNNSNAPTAVWSASEPIYSPFLFILLLNHPLHYISSMVVSTSLPSTHTVCCCSAVASELL
ncbi:unnamed protein product [Ectocarpus sp. 12 AP-2014]